MSHSSKIYPIDGFPVLFGTRRVRDLVIRVISGDEIQKYRTTFENLDFVAALFHVREGGNSTVGIDLEEPGFFLFVYTEV